MYSRAILLIALVASALGMVGLGVSYTNRGAALREAREKIIWQEDRYEDLVARSRHIQELLEEQQRETAIWQEGYRKLEAQTPVIRECTRTVVERIPEYIHTDVDDQRAEEVLIGLSRYMTLEVNRLLEETP